MHAIVFICYKCIQKLLSLFLFLFLNIINIINSQSWNNQIFFIFLRRFLCCLSLWWRNFLAEYINFFCVSSVIVPDFSAIFFGLYLTLIRKSSFSFKQVTIFLRHFKVCLSIRLKSYFSSITRLLFASVKSKSMFILRHFYGVSLLVKKILF